MSIWYLEHGYFITWIYYLKFEVNNEWKLDKLEINNNVLPPLLVHGFVVPENWFDWSWSHRYRIFKCLFRFTVTPGEVPEEGGELEEVLPSPTGSSGPSLWSLRLNFLFIIFGKTNVVWSFSESSSKFPIGGGGGRGGVHGYRMEIYVVLFFSIRFLPSA